MSARENIARIKVVHDALQELATEVVFVGGATVALYADRPAGEARPTDDVDILVELTYHREYTAVEEKLRAKGFANDVESGVICRYRVKGIVVDVMPTNDTALGFSNPWYKEGFATAVSYSLDENYSIRIFQPVYFLASKLEAFNNRGGGDGRWSSDFEDIVYVLNNRSTVWKELQAAEGDVGSYLKSQFGALLQNDYLDEWIAAHLDYSEQARIRTILGELRAFSNQP